MRKYVVSIIIPTYQAERTIKRCVNSLINQTYKALQIILVDDGSTDKTSEICLEYAMKDRRIEFIMNDSKGVSSARNNGIKAAQGEYILFVDSDDYINSNLVELLIIRKQRNPESFIVCGYNRVGADNAIIFKKKFEEKKFNINSKYQVNLVFEIMNYGTVWGKLYDSSIIKKRQLIFETTLNIHEDNLFLIKYLQSINSFVTVESCGYNYVTDYKNKSLSTNKNIDPLELINAYKKCSKASKELLLEWNIISDTTQNKYMSISYSFLINALKLEIKNNNRHLILSTLNMCNPKDISCLYKPKTIKGRVLKQVIYAISAINKIIIKKL